MQRASNGLYLTGTTFSAAAQTWTTATGTTSWSSAIAATTFSADGTHRVRPRHRHGRQRRHDEHRVRDRQDQADRVGFATTNVQNARRLEAGDTCTLTYSRRSTPARSSPAGTARRRRTSSSRRNSGTNDRLTVFASNGTTSLPLGTVALKQGDYVNEAMTFGLTGTPSTLTMSGSSLTIRLGTPSGTPGVAAAAANALDAQRAGHRPRGQRCRHHRLHRDRPRPRLLGAVFARLGGAGLRDVSVGIADVPCGGDDRSMARILLVEDEIPLARTLTRGMQERSPGRGRA